MDAKINVVMDEYDNTSISLKFENGISIKFYLNSDLEDREINLLHTKSGKGTVCILKSFDGYCNLDFDFFENKIIVNLVYDSVEINGLCVRLEQNCMDTLVCAILKSNM